MISNDSQLHHLALSLHLPANHACMRRSVGVAVGGVWRERAGISRWKFLLSTCSKNASFSARDSSGV